jgi:hypothetical protein
MTCVLNTATLLLHANTLFRFMQDWAVAVVQRLVRGWLARRIVAAKAVEVKLSHRVAFLADKFVKKGCLDVWGFLQQVCTLRSSCIQYIPLKQYTRM